MPSPYVWSSPVSLHVYWPELDIGFLVEPSLGAWWTWRGGLVGRVRVGVA